jgi:hypothetical protein
VGSPPGTSTPSAAGSSATDPSPPTRRVRTPRPRRVGASARRHPVESARLHAGTPSSRRICTPAPRRLGESARLHAGTPTTRRVCTSAPRRVGPERADREDQSRSLLPRPHDYKLELIGMTRLLTRPPALIIDGRRCPMPSGRTSFGLATSRATYSREPRAARTALGTKSRSVHAHPSTLNRSGGPVDCLSQRLLSPRTTTPRASPGLVGAVAVHVDANGCESTESAAVAVHVDGNGRGAARTTSARAAMGTARLLGTPAPNGRTTYSPWTSGTPHGSRPMGSAKPPASPGNRRPR